MMALEVALATPAFALLMLAGTDLVQLLRVKLRIDAAAVQMGQLVTSCVQITKPGDTTQFWAQAQGITGNAVSVTSGTGNGAVILTAVRNNGGSSRVAWQERSGASRFPSAIGAPGGTASLPGGYTVPAGETLLAVEVFGEVRPFVLSVGWFGNDRDYRLTSTRMMLSRSPDPVRLQSPPSNNSAMVCTA